MCVETAQISFVPSARDIYHIVVGLDKTGSQQPNTRCQVLLTDFGIVLEINTHVQIYFSLPGWRNPNRATESSCRDPPEPSQTCNMWYEIIWYVVQHLSRPPCCGLLHGTNLPLPTVNTSPVAVLTITTLTTYRDHRCFLVQSAIISVNVCSSNYNVYTSSV